MTGFQSYNSPILTCPTWLAHLDLVLFQSYNSPILTDRTKPASYPSQRFQSYNSPILTRNGTLELDTLTFISILQ